jgi:hypothetical protein
MGGGFGVFPRLIFLNGDAKRPAGRMPASWRCACRTGLSVRPTEREGRGLARTVTGKQPGDAQDDVIFNEPGRRSWCRAGRRREPICRGIPAPAGYGNLVSQALARGHQCAGRTVPMPGAVPSVGSVGPGSFCTLIFCRLTWRAAPRCPVESRSDESFLPGLRARVTFNKKDGWIGMPSSERDKPPNARDGKRPHAGRDVRTNL